MVSVLSVESSGLEERSVYTMPARGVVSVLSVESSGLEEYDVFRRAKNKQVSVLSVESSGLEGLQCRIQPQSNLRFSTLS